MHTPTAHPSQHTYLYGHMLPIQTHVHTYVHRCTPSWPHICIQLSTHILAHFLCAWASQTTCFSCPLLPWFLPMDWPLERPWGLIWEAESGWRSLKCGLSSYTSCLFFLMFCQQDTAKYSLLIMTILPIILFLKRIEKWVSHVVLCLSP